MIETGNLYGSGAGSSLLSSDSLPEIQWRGIGGAVGAALGASLLFLPAPFLRTLNGVPLALFTSIGLMLGSLAAWAADKFTSASDGSYFHPVIMLGGGAFAVFVILGVIAVRLVGIAGGASVVSGAVVIGLAAVRRWGLPAVHALGFAVVHASDAKDPQWLEIAGAGAVAVGAILGVCIPVRDMLASRHDKDGYDVIHEMNAELGDYNEEEDEAIDPLAGRGNDDGASKERHPRPGQAEALADSALNRYCVKCSTIPRRIVGIVCALVAGVLGALQLIPLIYRHGSDSFASSVSLVSTFKDMPVCDLFAFSCGAVVAAVLCIVISGLFACNSPSLPPQGALPCLCVGIVYAASILAWIWSRDELTGSLADPVSWGLIPIFASLWGLLIREQRGIAGHILAALSVTAVAIGSGALAASQRGIHNF